MAPHNGDLKKKREKEKKFFRNEAKLKYCKQSARRNKK